MSANLLLLSTYLFRCKYSQQSNSDTSYGSDLHPVPSGVCVEEEDKKEEGKNLTIHLDIFLQASLTMMSKYLYCL